MSRAHWIEMAIGSDPLKRAIFEATRNVIVYRETIGSACPDWKKTYELHRQAEQKVRAEFAAKEKAKLEAEEAAKQDVDAKPEESVQTTPEWLNTWKKNSVGNEGEQ